MISDKENVLEPLKGLIQKKTGLHIYKKDAAKFSHIVYERIHALSLASPEVYFKLLSKNDQDEWNTLKIELTSGESSFFRDKGQIELLRDNILPELIEKKAFQREMRLWSAGCSTGEEPYTLAMLLDHLLPNRHGWQLTIMGSDINEDSLQQASQGIYSQWTLRGVDQAMLEGYFTRSRDGWILSRGIRDMVQFKKIDLVEGGLPDRAAGLSDMDLIVCRNLFIYYESNQVAGMVEQLGRCLSQDGYLLTGHAEVPSGCQHGLNARIFPESVIYQRGGRTPARSATSPARNKPTVKSSPQVKKQPVRIIDALHSRPSPSSGEQAEAMCAKAMAHLKKGAHSQAKEMAQTVLAAKADDIDAAMIAARACANMGQHENAEQFCRQVASINPMHAAPYYLMAQLSQVHNDFTKTRQLLSKVIYLSPDFVPAYLELASVYEREGSTPMARKMRNSALDILKGMPSDATIAEYETIPVQQLVEHVQGMLE